MEPPTLDLSEIREHLRERAIARGPRRIESGEQLGRREVRERRVFHANASTIEIFVALKTPPARDRGPAHLARSPRRETSPRADVRA